MKLPSAFNPDELAMFVIQARLALLDNESGNVEDDEPFFVADLGQVYQQHQRWTRNLPAVQPFYAVKCNPDPTLLRFLAELGTGFDCASIDELKRVRNLGVDPSRIVFANPCKAASALCTARDMGVTKTTFDNLDELDSIKQFMPNAQLFLRIYASDDDALIQFGDKFGASPEATTVLLERAWDLGLEIVGVSFHVGTGATNHQSFVDAMERAETVFNQATRIGHHLQYLDIGGGFQDAGFERMASGIKEAVKLYMPPEVRIIAEPGRFYTRNAYTLVCKVISRRCQIGNDKSNPDMLYQNDGVYGNFMNVLVEKEIMRPSLVTPALSLTDSRAESSRVDGEHWYSIWGPTCDSVDCVTRKMRMDLEVKVGDWLMYKNMGAYTMATSTRFNGFEAQHPVIYINRMYVMNSIDKVRGG
ncbi:type III PLP-dependent enzyme [Aspergillus ruber CBS 135680]|uniref:ornithine decarboxylase n=1 Tax=Aspergillus ruber (strain CBS 135680) TaxID=1388766 RepID=A0A017SMM3_ASPRC|nr:putative ornithine decarboxylase [Aspergillus ruber CBS 135680]EYE97515.1 putative ornithine decarboxylase [Aspergillus ruber CBS 135680]